MKPYRFEFRGELLAGAERGEVQVKLAGLFCVEPEALDAIFQGKALFQRAPLAAAQAELYRQHFADLGALGRVSELDEPNAAPVPSPASAPGPSCPKCASVRLLAGQCQECGIYLHKHRSASPAQAPLDDEGAETEQRSAAAATWFGLAGLALTIAFVADDFLRDLPWLDRAGIDLGYWPFLLAHIPLVRGAVLLARLKGYPGRLGLLGLASLAVLNLLPDRRQRRTRLGLRSVVAALVCFALSLYWLAGVLGRHATLNTVQARSAVVEAGPAALVTGRHVYPSGELDSDEARYTAETDELLAYLDQTMASLGARDFRPDEEIRAYELMFQEMARLRLWTNHQRYLHLSKGLPLPEALQEDAVEQRERRLSDWLKAQGEAGPRFHQTLAYAQAGDSVGESARDRSRRDFNRFLSSEVHELLRQDWLSKLYDARASKVEGPVKPELRVLNSLHYPGLSLDIQGDTLSISGQQGPLKDSPLVLANLALPYQDREGKTQYLWTLVPVSYSFQNSYLSSYFNVLSHLWPE